ncbi:hypothetical protein SAMN05421853_11650 [Roseivivax halotolerans]|uniref:Uncharacterized protein n=1 Tax=Roseivivax halotolerans TaxID=93684 RepID=A0A1I6A9L4_9RHOB|nr:hypothetical protein [Roseivivax halotolerans]SFQ65378.1 hypothetical protein SAMN05421853_11650 [Roseivivax halotolerans]
MKDSFEDPNAERAHIHAYQIAHFCKWHGASLCDILEVVAGEVGVNLCCDLLGALSQKHPDPALVAELVDRARSMLEVAQDVPEAARDAHRWHGARLSELSA